MSVTAFPINGQVEWHRKNHRIKSNEKVVGSELNYVWKLRLTHVGVTNIVANKLIAKTLATKKRRSGAPVGKIWHSVQKNNLEEVGRRTRAHIRSRENGIPSMKE